MVLTFEFEDGILKCDHSNETSFALLSYNEIAFSAFYGMNLGKFSRILTLTNFGSEQGAISLWSNYP